MRRIDTPSGLFIGGDPATNTKGTVVTDDWLNALQEEIATLIEGAGMALDPLLTNQLAAAVKRYVDTVTAAPYTLAVENGVLTITEV